MGRESEEFKIATRKFGLPLGEWGRSRYYHLVRKQARFFFKKHGKGERKLNRGQARPREKWEQGRNAAQVELEQGWAACAGTEYYRVEWEISWLDARKLVKDERRFGKIGKVRNEEAGSRQRPITE